MDILPAVVSGRRNFAGLFGCNWFRKIILVVFRLFEFSHSQGQKVTFAEAAPGAKRPFA